VIGEEAGSINLSKVHLYDTTLRDGMQGQGMSLSAAEKVRVVEALDRLGVHYVEAGFPDSNPKDLELFERLASTPLEQTTIAAFGMTRRRGVEAAEDPGLAALVGCFAPVVTLVGKTWALHLEKVTKVSRDENLAMIADSVRHCSAAGKRVIYDAEHFFDGWRDDRGYARACLEAAVEAGAGNVSLCDTNGSSLPHEIEEATAAVAAALTGTGATIGIHTHNDAGCGVANSLAAVAAGATLVQGTVNGYGERTGNANLVSIRSRAAAAPHRDCASRRRDLQPGAGPIAALRRPQRLRPQGGAACGRRRGRCPHLRARRSGPGRQRARDPDLGARRPRLGPRAGRARRHRAR
jgi:2-isopropylmalate synthase